MLSVQTSLKKKHNTKKQLIIIVGPTAVGKTALSIELAQHYNCPILSFDSRQFFREMTIGTAKPTKEELSQATHFFIDSHSIEQDYTAGKFEADALEKLDEIYLKYDVCVAVGGSGLYIDALVFGIDPMPSNLKVRNQWIDLYKKEGTQPLVDFLNQHNPEVFQFIDKNNHARMIRAIEVIEVSGQKFTSFRKNEPKSRNFTPIWIGLDMERENLYQRINDRVDIMISEGLEKEVESLQNYQNHRALKTVGYAEFFSYFKKEITLEKCIELIKRNSRRYAKRQYTWFNKNPYVSWFTSDTKNKVLNFIDDKIKKLK